MTAIALPAPPQIVIPDLGVLLRLPRWKKPWAIDVPEPLRVIAVGGTPVGNTGAATTTQTVTGVGAANGDVIVAIAFAFSSTAETWNTPAFSDNGTDTGGSAWTNRADTGYVQRNRVIMGERVVGPSGTAPTSVTCSLNSAAGQDIAIAVFRLTGANTSSPHDASIGNSQTSATPSTGTLVTTNAADAIITGVCHDGATTTLTPPTGFTAGPETESAASEPFSTGYKIVAATQNQTYQWTLGASRNAVMVVGGWKASGAAGLTTDQSRIRTALQAMQRASFYMSGWRAGRNGILIPAT